eukprot:2098843-Pyramimonas_sp.AAC.1
MSSRIRRTPGRRKRKEGVRTQRTARVGPDSRLSSCKGKGPGGRPALVTSSPQGPPDPDSTY